MRFVWLAILAACFGFTPAHARAALPCSYDDKACAARAIQGHAVSKFAYWQEAFARPVEQRIDTAPPELVEYLDLDNIKNGHPDKPRAAAIPPDFLRDVRTAIGELPLEVRRLVSARLAGIYFVEDLGGSGFAEQIVGADGNPQGGWIVLSLSALRKQTANGWATWKENTPFKPGLDTELIARIESRPQNNRKNALQYILLHEFGHVVAIGGNIHPYWGMDPRDVPSTAEFPFFLLSWSISKADNRYVTRFDGAFPQRKNVVYYFGAKLAASQAAGVYDALEKTNFATLYSATNPFDDFAEAFANYVHTVLLKKPFEIEIYRNGGTAKVYKPCWAEARCVEKRKILERLLKP